MKFVSTTKSNVNNNLLQREITSLFLQKEFDININTTAIEEFNNNLCLSRKTTHRKGSQVIFKRNKKQKQQQNLSKKIEIFKNWKNQNFCIATS